MASDQECAADAKQQLQIVVIGAGAAGLVAAREAVREGHSVRVYESGNAIGGTWIYTDEVESDPTGAASLMKTSRRRSGSCTGAQIAILSHVLAHNSRALLSRAGVPTHEAS